MAWARDPVKSEITLVQISSMPSAPSACVTYFLQPFRCLICCSATASSVAGHLARAPHPPWSSPSIPTAVIQEAVDSPQSAWLLGYVLFFRLKRKTDLIITEADVTDAEKASNVQKPYLWRLIDRDGGRFATLPELMEGSEELFHERQAFARMLTGNVSVVRQVETVLAVVLLIVWVFIAAWIFDPGAVQRTWTALSAGLLSFSFIFSSTIREVWSLRLCVDHAGLAMELGTLLPWAMG